MTKLLALLFISISLLACGSGNNNNSKISAKVTSSQLSPGSLVKVVIYNNSANAIESPALYLSAWLESIATNKNLTFNGNLAPNESYEFSFDLNNNLDTINALRQNYQFILTNPTTDVLHVSGLNLPIIRPELTVEVSKFPTALVLWEDILINSDLWSDKPEIMSAGYAFEGIEGVPQGESNVISAGGAWQIISTANAPYTAYTSSKSPFMVETAWGYPTYYADAIPVVFSWPVLPSSVNRTNFAVTLNTGEVVTPYVASITPNLEYNERSVVVLFGEFGNRLAPDVAGAIYPLKVSVVEGLKLVGPNGPISAVGLTKDSTNAYSVSDGGPTLVAAKLSRMSILGEGIGESNIFTSMYPNNGVAYFGESQAQFRLRIYTSGGFSANGVSAMQPTDFEKFFRIQLKNLRGDTFWLTQSNFRYTFAEGNIEIIGLADLGLAGSPLNDGYTSDSDNYIDIILKGDESAMRLISAVDIPATNGYLPFYNPGGPGNNPTPGVTYTYPGFSRLQAVTMAIDDPKTVSYP